MRLPDEFVNMIFAKLTLVYGRDFLSRWEGLNLIDVKSDWAHELGGFIDHPQAIAFALQNLSPGKAPNVLEFRAIARRLPAPEFKALPAPAADREKVRLMIEECRKRMATPKVGN